LWAFVQATDLNFDSNSPPGRGWGFNPLAWQMLFFTGFASARGWLPQIRKHPAVIALSGLWLALGIVAIVPGVYALDPTFATLHDWIYAHAHKPDLDVRQYAHFLALAVVVLAIVDRRPSLLDAAAAKPFVTMGRQALTVFITGMILAHAGGIAFGFFGADAPMQLAVNAAGLGGIYAAARVAAAIKGRAARARGAAAPAALEA
jgi:hypothetical protein